MIVQSPLDYSAALSFLEEHETIAYDTETTGLNPRRDKIIGIGFSTSSSGWYVPLYIWNGTDLQPTGLDVRPFLEKLKTKRLIMHNASFDCRFTKAQFGVDLTSALHCDTMLLKHTCDEEFPFGLKEIATKLWGTDATKEKEEMLKSIKANGGKATEYYKADTAIIGAYCVQDVMLTMRLFHYYSGELKRQGLEDFYYRSEVLPLYVEVVIPMEERGVQIDVPLLETLQKDIAAEILLLEANIQHQIAPLCGIFTEWFLNKDYPYKETGRVGKYMKKTGATLREAQMHVWQTDYPFSNMFNLNSKFHLKKLFFDTLKEEPLSRTPTGMPQVDDDFIQSVSDKYPWAALLTQYNKLNKLKSTYIDRFMEEHENGRFYPSFQMHRTVSGRLAGDLQQLPRPIGDGSLVARYTDAIRRIIIAAPGSLLCSADYEQLEPTIFAHTSGDEALQHIFNTGLDFYSEVAIRTEGLPAVSSDKSAPNYLGKLDKKKRQQAKAYALGIAYGMTGYKLQFELGVPQDDADRLVADYLRAFPDLSSWINSSHDFAKYKGYVRTQSGRVRHLPRASALFRKYGERLRDSLQLWKDYHQAADLYGKAKADRKEYINLLNNAVNFQVQGLAASIMNRAAIAIARKLKSEQLQAAIVNQVHDELVLEVPVAEQERVFALVQDCMQNITKLDVPLRTVPQFGASYAECK